MKHSPTTETAALGLNMTWRDWLDKQGLTGLKIKIPFLDVEWSPKTKDKTAAWELYVELLTRITTQPLAQSHGDEKTALDSVYKLFPITREVLKNNGRQCIEFTKIAVIVLNQRVRPFTAKWHKLSTAGAFNDDAQCQTFRSELQVLQAELSVYTKALADIAGVEDLTELEKVKNDAKS